MKTHAAFLTLVAELGGDMRELSRLTAQNERAWERICGGANDPIDWGALGYTLHAVYGVLENYFLRVSKFFENTLPGDALPPVSGGTNVSWDTRRPAGLSTVTPSEETSWSS